MSQLDRYDTLLVGTPNWFGTIAPPVQTFLKDSDLSGKRVAPFCTNGGGGFGTIPRIWSGCALLPSACPAYRCPAAASRRSNCPTGSVKSAFFE